MYVNTACQGLETSAKAALLVTSERRIGMGALQPDGFLHVIMTEKDVFGAIAKSAAVLGQLSLAQINGLTQKDGPESLRESHHSLVRKLLRKRS